MSPALATVAAGVAALVAGWAVLALLARTLPPGLARDLAAFIPDCVTTIRRLRRDERVPRAARIAVLGALVYLLNPIDLVPEFIPIVGPLDDAVIVAIALRYAARRMPREVLLAAWPGETRILDRLLGRAAGRS